MAMQCVPVTEVSQVAAARRAALQMAHGVGLSETEMGALALVVTEAASNLVKYAQAGQMLLRGLDQVMRFSGVGNIAGMVCTATGSHGLASQNGIVGYAMHRRQAFTYPWSLDAVVVLYSDGLQTRWRLDAYPGLARRHPSLIAGVLYRDFARGRDDVTVLVAAAVPPSGPGTSPGEE